MNTINRMMTNICSGDLNRSKLFYTKLFDFKIDFDSDWFVHLIFDNNQQELGIISRTHEAVPKEAQEQPMGFYLTFVVDNADEVFELAKAEKIEIIEKPTDTSYGQRRLLLRDPDGVIVDVSSPIKGFQF